MVTLGLCRRPTLTFRSILAALLITAARMVDVVAGKMVERPQVVVTDGRIVSVGQAGDTVPTGSRVVWLPGMTLLPGLIDMHVHLTSVAAIDGHRGLDYTNSFWTAAGVGNALKTLRADFTTVRNVGSANFDDVGLRQAIDEGYVPGPRIVAATWALGATGGHCNETGLPPRFDHREPSVFNGPRRSPRAGALRS